MSKEWDTFMKGWYIVSNARALSVTVRVEQPPFKREPYLVLYCTDTTLGHDVFDFGFPLELIK